MPEANYGPQLYPESQEGYDRLLSWCNLSRQDARAARLPYEENWERWYRLYRSYINRNKKDWRSKVFMPEVFQTIETVLPRMVAQLPKFLVNPKGPEDVAAAKKMEMLLAWATENSNLYVELIDVFKDALMYGTGILKTMVKPIYAYGRKPVPIFGEEIQRIPEPLMDPDTGDVLRDPDGNPVIEERELRYQVPAGVEMQRYRYTTYEGPMAQCIDLWNFWVAPEAEDVQNADFVIHQTFKRWEDVKRLIADGTYRVPDDFDETAFFDQSQDMPHMKRQQSIDMGSTNRNANRKKIKVEEFWINDGADNPGRVITIANEKLILRVQENPFDHGEKPFIRFVDYKQAHEFWGVGEIEAVEGLQDLMNAIVNQRVDNVRLSMDRAYAVNVGQLEDTRDLVRRPGQVIRVKGDGMRPGDVVQPIDFGDVTGSAFAEAEQTQRMMERVTAVSGLQQGVDTPALTDTATGMAMLSEAGATRFAHKVRQAEIMSLKPLGYQYGSLLQQFTSEPTQVRLTSADGSEQFEPFDPLELHGRFDYSIEPSSIQQSDTVRKEQALSLLREVAPFLANNIDPNTGTPLPLHPGLRAMLSDLMESFGKKTVQQYLGPEITQQLGQTQQTPQMLPPMPGDMPPEMQMPPEEMPPDMQMGPMQ